MSDWFWAIWSGGMKGIIPDMAEALIGGSGVGVKSAMFDLDGRHARIQRFHRREDRAQHVDRIDDRFLRQAQRLVKVLGVGADGDHVIADIGPAIYRQAADGV